MSASDCRGIKKKKKNRVRRDIKGERRLHNKARARHEEARRDAETDNKKSEKQGEINQYKEI